MTNYLYICELSVIFGTLFQVCIVGRIFSNLRANLSLLYFGGPANTFYAPVSARRRPVGELMSAPVSARRRPDGN